MDSYKKILTVHPSSLDISISCEKYYINSKAGIWKGQLRWVQPSKRAALPIVAHQRRLPQSKPKRGYHSSYQFKSIYWILHFLTQATSVSFSDLEPIPCLLLYMSCSSQINKLSKKKKKKKKSQSLLVLSYYCALSFCFSMTPSPWSTLS